jgi:hypothetical protein
MTLWPFLLGLVLLELVVFMLWMSSGAIDCYPHCTAYQDTVAWGAWFLLPPVIIVLAVYGVVRWAVRRRRGNAATER